MKRFKTVLISFALLIGLNPIAAYANPQTLGGWLFLMQYAVDHCYLNGTIPGQRIDIILNADQILIDIGAESTASELARIMQRFDGYGALGAALV